MKDIAKRVVWDADFYKAQSDDDCIVCLTRREIYILGQVVDMIGWVDTRWVGDISGLNFFGIQGELERRLADMLPCENLTQLVGTVNELQNEIAFLQLSINNIAFGNSQPEPQNDWKVTDGPNATRLREDLFGDALLETCDKDAVYGAVSALVDVMNQNNLDFLERLALIDNLGDRANEYIEMVETRYQVPIDEYISIAAGFTEEFLQSYIAAMDVDLRQAIICDLFCIATNEDPSCHLDFAEVLNYFSDKIPGGVPGFATTYLDLLQFAVSGTFTGSTLVYFMFLFQLWLILAGWKFLSYTTMDKLAMQVRAGLLNPSDEWSVFCTACPQLLTKYLWDFEDDLGDWIVKAGEYQSGIGVVSTESGGFNSLRICLEIPTPTPAYRIEVRFATAATEGQIDIRRDELLCVANAPSQLTLWNDTDWWQTNRQCWDNDGAQLIPATNPTFNRLLLTVLGLPVQSGITIVKSVAVWFDGDPFGNGLTGVYSDCE